VKRPYDFLSPEEHGWVERCGALAVVVVIVILGLFAGLAFGADTIANTGDTSVWRDVGALA
jgi:hypothetical protein